ncbi:hypothetical protein HZA97_06635 [Candidatus Woesearchaeota archaeon]|nr:hypothetical protein [Candidatus Woesearchaeota archaeon]
MLEDEIKKIIDEFSEVSKKHGLYSYETSEYIKQYESTEMEEYLKMARRLLRIVNETFGEDIGQIDDKVAYYEDGEEGLGSEEDKDDLNNF